MSNHIKPADMFPARPSLQTLIASLLLLEFPFSTTAHADFLTVALSAAAGIAARGIAVITIKSESSKDSPFFPKCFFINETSVPGFFTCFSKVQQISP